MRLTDLEQTAAVLRCGRPAIFKTDTVYGVGVSVQHAANPFYLADLKGRSHIKPVAWLVSGPEDLDIYGCDIPEYAYMLARAYWPGALTLIVKATEAVSPAFQSETGTVGLRMPECETTIALIRLVGAPLATTSANLAGKPAPKSVRDVDRAFADAVGVVMEDGTICAASGTASTVVDCTGANPIILREGEIPKATVQALARSIRMRRGN